MTELPHVPVLRAGREYRSLSLNELRDHRTGETVALASEANAGLVRRDLRATSAAARELRAQRASELVEIGRGGISYRQVGRSLKRRALQLLHERLEPGADTGVDMLRHEAEESGVVIRGKLELSVGGQTYVLGPGDAYYFDSRLPHRFRNVGSDVCEVVSACTPPSF